MESLQNFLLDTVSGFIKDASNQRFYNAGVCQVAGLSLSTYRRTYMLGDKSAILEAGKPTTS